MNISLTPELEKFVQQKVNSGMYHSASEVIRDGLRLLQEREQLRQLKLEELRQDILRGVNSGKSTQLERRFSNPKTRTYNGYSPQRHRGHRVFFE